VVIPQIRATGRRTWNGVGNSSDEDKRETVEKSEFAGGVSRGQMVVNAGLPFVVINLIS
jgi:hypothetical protein